jgi:general secretion pathway protein G
MMRPAEHFRLRLGQRSTRHPWAVAAGFTLLEMMIVITIMLILMSIGAGRYEQSIVRAREAALKQDLITMRRAIDQYTIDKEQPPQSLDDLVTAGYMRGVPVDPITRKTDWRTVEDQVVLTPEQTQFGITDVHSNSDDVSPFEKTPYSSW